MKAGGTLQHHLVTSLVKVSVLLAAVLILVVLPRVRGDYGSSSAFDSRTVVWVVTELHLMFAAFVLGVPIFAMIVEIAGAATKDERYDRMAREVDLADAGYVGDTIVGVEADDEFEAICGECVEGEKEAGVTLRILVKGQWVQKRIPQKQIEFVNAPMSPMPANFAELLQPREVYDLIAYLSSQKGGKP